MTGAAGKRSSDSLGLIGQIGIVPVVTIDDIDAAVPLVRAVVDGGLTAVEITLRTPAGLASISRSVADVPDAVVGAGSVTTAAATNAAIEAGARFVVSPGLDDGVIAAARARDVAVLPGVGTATELMRAVAMDVDIVKLFPADALGGPAFVRALSTVWPAVRFVPTGGVSAATASDYLASPAVLAVGGSWMISRAAVADGRWDEIRAAAEAAVELARMRT